MIANDVASTPEPVRSTIRIVGFKVADGSPSPTSVLTSRDSAGSPTSSDSASPVWTPRSKLAEALRQETFHPLPRLKIKAAPRLQGPGFKRSFSHADLPTRDCSSPLTPGSRASTASTPMRIPSALARVKTCPIELVDLSSLSASGAVAATIPAAGSLQRRAAEGSPTDGGGDGASLARDLYAAGAFAAPAAGAEGGYSAAAADAADAAEASAPGLGDLQAEMQRLQVQTAPAPPPRMLRLPAAAVHRRARSEGMARRLALPS